MTSEARHETERAALLEAARVAIAGGTFVRITLGKYRGAGEAVKIVVTPVVIKGASHLRFVYSAARSDTTENLGVEDGLARLQAVIGGDFLSATLFMTDRDMTISYTKKRVAHLSSGKPTFTSVPSVLHDRAKAYAIDPAQPYLKALGVSDQDGRVKPSMFAKFKQIGRFVEILDGLMKEAGLAELPLVSVLDIGAGKGYLTFALYDHITAKLGLKAALTGIEVRGDLVRQSNALAQSLGYAGLAFEAVPAASVRDRKADLVIALHACDTATDDALAQGVLSSSKLIVTSPCCQHELAPQLRAHGEAFSGLIKFPLLKQRQADLVTDAARALLLEAAGYAVTVIEFVTTEHTAKNLLIAAVKSERVDRKAAMSQYQALKLLAGFEHHALETQLKDVL